MHYTRGIIATLALTGVATAAAKDSEEPRVHGINLLLPAQWTPTSILASVVNAAPTATTFALACAPKAGDDCSVFVPTVTQGPKTWAYSGEWADVQGVDEYTMNNECEVNQGKDRMVCTLGITQVKGGKTASTEIVSTTTGLEEFVHAIPITAGAHKIEADMPKPTEIRSTKPESTVRSTTLRSSTRAVSTTTTAVSLPTLLPTANLAAADATKDAVGELPTEEPKSEDEDVIQGTPTPVPTAAASVSKAHVGVVGLAVLVGGMLAV